jgi:hypothetical protein
VNQPSCPQCGTYHLVELLLAHHVALRKLTTLKQTSRRPPVQVATAAAAAAASLSLQSQAMKQDIFVQPLRTQELLQKLFPPLSLEQ